MIAISMVYVMAFTAVYVTAARVLERAARVRNRPTRHAWTSALVVTLVVAGLTFAAAVSPTLEPAAAPALSSGLGQVNAPAGVSATTGGARAAVRSDASPLGRPAGKSVVAWLRANTLRVTADSRLSDWDRAVLRGWGVLSFVWLLVLGASAVRLARAKRGWREEEVDGSRVFVSANTGPAVVGLAGSRVVVPQWIVDSPRPDRALVIAHEMEHVRAGDSRLLFASALLLALMPWNLTLWWITRRLRFAIEADCDARVLRAHPDRRAYGTLLLDVSERAIAGPVPVAALAESRWMLERRLMALTEPQSPPTMKRHLAYQFGAFAIAITACAIPRPDLVVRSDDGRSALAMTSRQRTPGALDVRYANANVGMRIESTAPAPETEATVTPMATAAATTVDSGPVPPVFVGKYSTDAAAQSCGRSVKEEGGWAPWGALSGSAATAEFPGLGPTWGVASFSRRTHAASALTQRLIDETRRAFPAVFDGSSNSVQLVAYLVDQEGRVIDRMTCYRPPVVEHEWMNPQPLVQALFPGMAAARIVGSGTQSISTRDAEFAPGNLVDVIAVWGAIAPDHPSRPGSTQ
jgi:beta-lactamase regulating signal transducer with metallopeptidase domain